MAVEVTAAAAAAGSGGCAASCAVGAVSCAAGCEAGAPKSGAGSYGAEAGTQTCIPWPLGLSIILQYYC